MKTLITLIALFVSLVSFGQTQNYLYSLFNGEISKDDFLMSQKHSYIYCEGYEYHVDGGDKKVNLTDWVYSQDFTKYQDTSKYIVEYSKIKSCNNVVLESIVIYDKSSMVIVRSFLNSYYPKSSVMTSLNDSDLDS